jgi:ABC-2 type transport system permease protein
MVAGVVLVVSFFISGLAELSETVKAIADFSPITYYQGGKAMTEFKPEWILGLLGIALVFTLVAWWRFERREIRVGGEGGWTLPLRRLRANRAA